MPRTDHRAQSTPPVVGSGLVRERIITAPPFARLRIASVFRATFSLDSDFHDHVTLRFRADDNVLPHVQARLREGVLYICLNRGHYRDVGELSVSARLGELSELVCGDDSRIWLRGNARKLRIESSGASQVHVALAQSERIDIAARDASEVSFEGSTDRISLVGRGTASLRAERATHARIELAGASRARIVARRSIAGRVRFPCQLSVACAGAVQIAGAYRSE